MSVTNTYAVVGMTCGHCEQAVTAELGRLPGVHDVRVDLSTGSVAVTSDGPLPIDEVRAAVDEAGYELAGADAPTNG
jgi:copper chaperone CopZ